MPTFQAVRSLRESVDVTRLSRIALSNLEKDDGVTDYTAAQPSAQGGDITIDSADAELDFEEIQEDGMSPPFIFLASPIHRLQEPVLQQC